MVIAPLAIGHLPTVPASFMNTPSLLLGATLLFWGWQAGLFWLGMLLAVAIEVPRLVRARWTFAQADLDRIWNLCVLLFFGAIVVAFVANDGARAVGGLASDNSMASRLEAANKGARSVVLVLQWLPLTFLPIALAQAFSQRERMAWSTFSVWLRRQRKAGPARDRRREEARIHPASGRSRIFEPPHVGFDERENSGLNVGWPYFVVCLLAASAANERTIWFSVGVAGLTGWALWRGRSRSFPAVAWSICLLAAIGLGLAAQIGLRELQGLLRQLDGALVARFAGGRGFDPKESRTMLGSIGRLKLSGSIVLRVEAEGAPPPLLREASYNLFRSPYWAVPRQQQEFAALNSENDLTTWKLLPQKLARKNVTVAGYLAGGQGLLAVPHGVATLAELPAELQTNRFGVLNVTNGPGLVRFRAAYDEGASIDGPPDHDDVEMPNTERAAVIKVAAALGLEGLSPEDTLRRLAKFFAGDFRYTTWLGDRRWRRTNETALSEFLLKTKAGHCEYFATATALLLRAAGIPTRYAVGYAVLEKKGDQWIVRERHAHAWCLAWVNGAWHDVDNTPASWAEVESARASTWERISDAWSTVWFEFSKWRWGRGEWKRYVLWLLAPLLALAGWRLMAQKQWSRARSTGHASGSGAGRLGLDSEFYLVERRLAELGLERREGETLSAWLTRIGKEEKARSANLRPLVTLHYRLRFDPAGLAKKERDLLRSEVAAWLQ
jgi:hypothetical protein